MTEYVLVASLLACTAGAWLRNRLVYRERLKVIRAVHRMGLREIWAGGDATWRWAEYHRGVTYDEMMWKFWRPVSSFYRGARCLQPHEELT